MLVFLYCLQALEKEGAYQDTVKSSPRAESDLHKELLMQPPQMSGTCRPGVTAQQSIVAKVAVAQALPQSHEPKAFAVGGVL